MYNITTFLYNSMRLIEIETKVETDGVIRIPIEELKATGLKEGDEVCLMYVEGTCGKESKCI